MSLFSGRKKPEVFDSDPGTTGQMPARPYRVLQADLPFYLDPECRLKAEDARLVVLRSEDPKQEHQVLECMPTRKRYKSGQLVQWELDNKKMWQACWYANPETGKTETAWIQAAEFIGRVVTASAAISPAS